MQTSDSNVDLRAEKASARRELLIIVRQEKAESSPSRWDALERASKTLSIAAIPIVLAVMGVLAQRQLQDRAVSRDYVQLAVSILQDPDTEKVTPELREWAVNLLNDNSPTKLSQRISDELKSGRSILPTGETKERKSFLDFLAGHPEVSMMTPLNQLPPDKLSQIIPILRSALEETTGRELPADFFEKHKDLSMGDLLNLALEQK